MGIFSASDKVRFKIVKEDACEALFSVEVPAAHVESETQNSLVRFQQRARLPGFRPGKAPLDFVRQQFGEHLKEEVLEHFMHKHVPEALRELNLNPVATPSVTKVEAPAGKPLHFEVRVEVPPRVAPKNYTGIKLERRAYPATDEALAARLEELREAHARLERAAQETVGKTHYVVIDYAAVKDGKPHPKDKGVNELVDMSSQQTVPGLVEGLLGMKRDETKAITVKFNGQDTQLCVSLKEIKTKILPPLDADFAKDMGLPGLDELKAKLREIIGQEGKAKTERELSEQLEAGLLKANPIPVPPSLAEAELEHMMERLKSQLLGHRGEFSAKQVEELKAKIKGQAEDRVRISFLLPAIAAREKLEVTDAEIEAELQAALAATPSDEEKENMRKMFTQRRPEVKSMLRDRKTHTWMLSKASITEALVPAAKS